MAPFTLPRKPRSNYTLIEAQCRPSSVGKNADSASNSYTRRLNFRCIMKLEKNCYEVCDF